MTWASVMAAFIVFFFQAEDGIRDKLVTGVQTCALPILVLPPHANAPTALARPTLSPAGALACGGSTTGFAAGLASRGEAFRDPARSPRSFLPRKPSVRKTESYAMIGE